MSNFVNKSIDLGEIPEKVRHKIIFESKYDLNDIRRLVPSCGCIKTSIEGKKIITIFKPGFIPKHLKVQITRKTIVVYYNNGQKEVLSFTAKIIK